MLVEIDKVLDWLDGFLEYSSLIEYQVSEEEKKKVFKSFMDHINGVE